MMEPITYYFDSIDRLAISVKPKQPMKDWVLNLFPKDNDIPENNIYLVGKVETLKDLQTWLQKNFKKIFDNELNEWYQDKSNWPKKRTFKLFNDWFEIDYFTLVYDVEDTEIEK